MTSFTKISWHVCGGPLPCFRKLWSGISDTSGSCLVGDHVAVHYRQIIIKVLLLYCITMKGGLWRSKIGVKHITNLENQTNQRFLAFCKVNIQSISEISIRQYVVRSWNQWFKKLSLKMDPQIPLDPKPHFFQVH